MPSDSGSSRAASGGALDRRKIAADSKSTTAATVQSVLRVRLVILDGAPARDPGAGTPFQHIESAYSSEKVYILPELAMLFSDAMSSGGRKPNSPLVISLPSTIW